MYTVSTLRRKANQAGYELQKGKQRYLHKDWGLVKDYQGNTYTGFQILDRRLGAIIAGVSDINDHDLDLDEAADWVSYLCKMEGVPF